MIDNLHPAIGTPNHPEVYWPLDSLYSNNVTKLLKFIRPNLEITPLVEDQKEAACPCSNIRYVLVCNFNRGE
jgi:hypothetical protein